MSPFRNLRRLTCLAMLLGGFGCESAAPGTPLDAAGDAPVTDAAVSADAPSPDTAPPDDGPREGCTGNQEFLIGAGIYDITGPAAEVGMMGYAMLDQKTSGIHTRLRSRAFVIASPCNGKRIVYVSADLAMIFQGVKQQVVERLQATYGDVYGDANVMLGATHTHSGPGAFSHYTLYNLTTLGYDRQNFDAIVDGIYQSIVRADANLAPGIIRIARGDLVGASINRSAEAYLANPEAERAQYLHQTNKLMTVLRLERTDGIEVGAISWFAVHATSMGNKNHLISGDNKGYASYLFEKLKGTDYGAATTFVAAFPEPDAADASPNIYGGEQGEGADDFESTAANGTRQFTRALELYDQATELLTGGVDYRHQYVKMDEVQVEPGFTGGTTESTCTAALGISMIAGAEDGPGFGSEGADCDKVSDLFTAISCNTTSTECQAEKPIVISLGDKKPYPWVPDVLPMQLFRIGNLAIAAVPAEITTMSGRRLRKTVLERLEPTGTTDVVISACANAYVEYVTTREEYATQNYEGASTQFGPWELAAIQQNFGRLAAALAAGTEVDPGPTPPDLRDEQTTLQPGVIYDDKLLWVEFGEVKTDADESYQRGDTVSVVFHGAHPKNGLHTQGSFLEVQRKVSTEWVAVAHDWDWETKYIWARSLCVPTFGCSHITVEWTIPETAIPGTYRIRHDGDWKSVGGTITPYTGYSREFTVN